MFAKHICLYLEASLFSALVRYALTYACGVKEQADVVGAALAGLDPLQQGFAAAGLADAIRIAHSGDDFLPGAAL